MFFAIWQVLAWIIHRPIMPSPLQVLPIFTASVFGNLGIHFLASTARVLAAIGVAVVTAVPIGLGLGQVPKVNPDCHRLPDPQNCVFAGYLCFNGDHRYFQNFFDCDNYLFPDSGCRQG
jgi:hypothetical protein